METVTTERKYWWLVNAIITGDDYGLHAYGHPLEVDKAITQSILHPSQEELRRRQDMATLNYKDA